MSAQMFAVPAPETPTPDPYELALQALRTQADALKLAEAALLRAAHSVPTAWITVDHAIQLMGNTDDPEVIANTRAQLLRASRNKPWRKDYTRTLIRLERDGFLRWLSRRT